MCRRRNDADPVMLNKKVFTEFWTGQTDPAAAKQFTRLHAFFMDRLSGKVKMPAIPALSDEDLRSSRSTIASIFTRISCASSATPCTRTCIRSSKFTAGPL